MVVGRRHFDIEKEIKNVERKLWWLKLKPFKNGADMMKIKMLKGQLAGLKMSDNLTQY